MSVSLWMDQSSAETIKKDITIIGGGLSGLSAAYWLQKEDPTLKIALVEKHQIGDGATGRNAGFITCGSVEHFSRLKEKHGEEEALEIWRFSEDNLRYLKEEIIEGEEKELLFEQKGSFSLASTDSEYNELKESAKIMEKLDIAVEVVDEESINRRLGSQNFVGGIKYCGDASVHPLKMLWEIRNKIERKGKTVEFFENSEVHAIENINGNKLIRTRSANIESPIVVYATNGYSPLLHSFFEDKIFPTRGQIIATAPLPMFMEAPCYANFVLDYFRQLPTGQVIIGGFRQLQFDVEKGYSDETTDVIQTALEKFLVDHIPNATEAPITHRWSGLMGFSADGQAMVGALPTDPQSYFIGGYTCHGIGLAFHSGKVLADTLFEKPVPSFISARRFQ